MNRQLPTALYKAEQVRQLDTIAIEEFKIPGIELMERAGKAAFDTARSRWPDAHKILLFCGTGNNGGDGYVVGRLYLQCGCDVTVVELGDASARSPVNIIVEQAYLKEGGRVLEIKDVASDIEMDLIVDALFGTGLTRPVSGIWAQAVAMINDLDAPVFALDVPTGLHSDTGQVLGSAVAADATISFIGLKQGCFTGRAQAYVGDVYFDDLSVPPDVYQLAPSAELMRPEILSVWLPARDAYQHKGDFGHVLVVGGDYGMGGAACMAAQAAARAGAGLISVATRPSHVAPLLTAMPELMCHAVESARDLEPLLDKATAIIIGPGLGQSPWSHDLWQAVMHSPKPKVIDADALNLWAKDPQALLGENVFTPHPGEAARLLATDTASVASDRFLALQQLVNKTQAVCVLKGAGTLVGSAQHRPRICRYGNPGMASGGMGDVLSGVIGGLLAQGLSAFDASSAGVLVHALAGDRAARVAGQRGMLATDLLPHIRRLVNPDQCGGEVDVPV